MEDDSNSQPASISRRRLLQEVALASGGAAILGATMMNRAHAAQVSQKIVAYQETPHGAQQCDNCAQFQPPSSCKVVEGTISPTGWCKVYVKKPTS
ncbi:MAG TPA: high-potential iron-sulfur protein [Stellaceae bacterium]|nr:high-potential iron-sulfur protein [Stellaceae bacterium]